MNKLQRFEGTLPICTLNLDWLQLNCRTNFGEFKGFCNAHKSEMHEYEIKKLQFGTRHFKTVEEVYHLKKRIATIAREPHSEVINKATILVKFENNFLYDLNLSYKVQKFLNDFNLKLHNISRVDIAFDFQEFHNGLQPQNLIKKFLNNDYLKKGKGKGACSFKHEYHISHTYLRFGSQTSNLVYYLYNKSLEMEEVKKKPWIVERWQQCGFDMKKTTWRLEFSIKNSQSQFMDEGTGELFQLKPGNNNDPLEIIRHEKMNFLFEALINKYFVFYINDGTRNKSRMKEVKLFKTLNVQRVYQTICNKIESNRSDKIFIKKLNALNDELRINGSEMKHDAEKLLMAFIESRKLRDWCIHKGILK